MTDLSPFAKSLKDMAGLYRADEEACLLRLLPAATLSPEAAERSTLHATSWIDDIRANHKPQASVNDLLARFGLTSHEGLALMCLAEALLRIPDRATADALIKDKLSETHWNAAIGKGAPWSMNLTGWALSITGKIIDLDDPLKKSPGAALGKLVARLGQPVIREAIKAAMQWLADQFVTGENIADALERSRSFMDHGTRFSFDMLGEGARTADDADRYFASYDNAIDVIGRFQARYTFPRPSGISIKLSALHPRYEMNQRERVVREMVPRLIQLCEKAASYNIPVTIDAEEVDRLQLSLDVANALLRDAKLGSWEGLGFAVQAYQKRAPAVIDGLIHLSKTFDRRIHIRLVKGAYWDSEIKRAQEKGWSDFPVFTRKIGTDVSYLACARRILEAGDNIMPVFGTHNALTVAHILEIAPDPKRVEFQKLHGMNDDLYHLMRKENLNLCVYAPVGDHDVLLGYLVRRILENGANSSFVHRLLDRSVPVSQLVLAPAEELRSVGSFRNPSIVLPYDLFGSSRINSKGADLTDPFETAPLLNELQAIPPLPFPPPDQATEDSIDRAFKAAHLAQRAWCRRDVAERAACLLRLSDLLEKDRTQLIAFLVREAGKTLPDAISEIREAVDFCRYYADQARHVLKPQILPGPVGEVNTLRLIGRGVFLCISPWNFPLAIFLGQVAAAVVTGNAVIAKPAPQTPLIALHVEELAKQAGIPDHIFHVITGGPKIGSLLTDHPLVAGVAFTGSTATGRLINRALAAKDGPIVPLIAETGGQNALIVDSSALPEQVVDDVILSAFRSAGQRCSALRILCLPEPTADKILDMLKGAMKELKVGDPSKLENDVGPVIDSEAQKRLLQHVARLKAEATEIVTCDLNAVGMNGSFVPPQAWEIPAVAWLRGEVFGPILHVVRYAPDDIDSVIRAINATGFGLTGGLHSRIDATVQKVEDAMDVGNFYVNRSLIGAVVGVQPFGGEGLSGTGPKAGGPHYLYRFAYERVTSNNVTAAGGNASLMMESGEKSN